MELIPPFIYYLGNYFFMKRKVPSLLAYHDNPVLALNVLLSYYFKTLKSQSKIHYNQTLSLMYDINTASTADGIENAVTDSLNRLLEPYFDRYRVTVECNGSDGGYDVVMKFNITDNGNDIDIGQIMNIKNNKLVNVKTLSELGNI